VVGGVVAWIQICFSSFIFIPFNDAIFAKPFVGQTAWANYSGASSVVFTLLAVVAYA
jgi:hypothetical protein